MSRNNSRRVLAIGLDACEMQSLHAKDIRCLITRLLLQSSAEGTFQ